MTYQPGKLTKTVYVVGLAIVILSFVVRIPTFTRLLSKVNEASDYPVVITALTVYLVSVVLTIVGGVRIVQVVRGKATLKVNDSVAACRVIRTTALVCLYLGLASFMFGFSRMSFEGLMVAMALGSFGHLIPVGLALYEFSRLVALEKQFGQP